ncbi:MAG: Nif11-like leader peptide family RiPP precursor [Xenococcaceae cyanobacterium]
MSIENAKAFYERMTTDEAFRTQYQNATTDEERQAIVADYKFTQEEWEAASTEIIDVQDDEGEISDAELESIAGGFAVTMAYGGGFLPKDYSWLRRRK